MSVASSNTGVYSLGSVTSTAAIVLPAYGDRNTAIFYNSGSTVVYLGLGFSPTTSAYTVQVAATGGTFTLPQGFTGNVWAVSATTGTLQITELR